MIIKKDDQQINLSKKFSRNWTKMASNGSKSRTSKDHSAAKVVHTMILKETQSSADNGITLKSLIQSILKQTFKN